MRVLKRLTSTVLMLLSTQASATGIRPGGLAQTSFNRGVASQTASSRLLGNYFSSLGWGSNKVQDPCVTFASEMGAPSACLNGLGTSSGTMTLSAVGSPTTQTMAWCENGLSCDSVSRQVVSASAYYQTASMAQPSGSFWYCSRGIVDAPLPATASYAGQVGSWVLNALSTGVLKFTANAGAFQLLSSTGLVVGGASHLACLAYHFVGSGSVNSVTLYLDGAQVAQSTTAPVLASVSVPITIGQFGGASPISRLGFAMFGTGDPSGAAPWAASTTYALGAKTTNGGNVYVITTAGTSASSGGPTGTGTSITDSTAVWSYVSPILFQRLAAATAPTPQGTRGEALTFARASAASCIAPDGSVTWLQPGRPCISGGIRVRPAVTNLYLQSQAIASGSAVNAPWTSTGGATFLADQAVGPDGAKTADLITFSASTDRIRQTFTATATAYTEAFSVKAVSGTPTLSLQIFDATLPGQIGSTQCVTNATSWTRCVATSSVATAGHAIQAQFQVPAGNPTAAFYLDDAQFEPGTVASDPCRSEGTSATCAAETAGGPKPTSLSTTEGCARYCVTPAWSGSNPMAATAAYLDATSGTVSHFGRTSSAASSVFASNGTTTATVAGGFVAGVRQCFLAQWSASAGTLKLTNQATASTQTTTGFTAFPAFASTIGIGCTPAGALQANATLDSIQLGASATSCQ